MQKVRETASFIADESWIDVFGRRLYMQMPDKMDGLRGMEQQKYSAAVGFFTQ